MTVVWVPRDSAARSVGADAVAAALAAAGEGAMTVKRNGSRGMFWLEPLLEVETAAGRLAYGPVTPGDVAALVAARLFDGGDHPLRLGLVDDIPYLARQDRRTFARAGVADPLDLSAFTAAGGLVGLRKALAMPAADIVAEVTRSGLRGRGGAGFPAGIKWKTVAAQPGPQKYVACNADEGDSGTFADRLVMEGDPFALITGMTIAGLAVGADTGFIYIRSEYPDAIAAMNAALEAMNDAGWLGDDIDGTGKRFRLIVRRGAGAYICGEETSMLESLEGKRGEVRVKPPIPAIAGLFAQPTVVNNVLTLAAVPHILADGGAAYESAGMGRSRGTQPFQLAGNIKRGGLVEVPFGITLRELIEDFGGGTASGRPFRAAQIGGPLGAYVDASMLDLAMDYETLAEHGAMLGHGGIVVFDDTVDMAAMARFAFEFCAIESCGKCTPCRIGAVRGVEAMDRLMSGRDPDAQTALIGDLCELMVDGSLCAMGGLTPNPVRSAMKLFPEDFQRHNAVS
ncbi:MAG: formate dehydrogenase beta subunit [Alphaproteobacteria bacterium]